MKNKLFAVSFFTVAFLSLSLIGCTQKPENWTAKELMEPAQLAADIKAKKDIPLIINVGPATTIPNSIDVGMNRDKDGQEKLKQQLAAVAKDKKIVIYCGCCPFEHCPNVRPAIDILRQMKFTNFYLLNIPHNMKTDWIEKGYPTSL